MQGNPQQRETRDDEQLDEPTDRAAATAGEPDIVPCDAAFLFGSGLEAGGLVDGLKSSETSRHAHGTEHAGKLDGREVVIVESGVGGKAAARAAREAIKFYEPRWVISAGFATALCEELRRGHVLMADEVASPAGEKLAIGIKLEPHVAQATRGLHVGRLLTVGDVVRKPAERRQLQEQHEALACDMETFAIAAACRDVGAKLISVRLITDAVDDELPPEIEHLLAQKTVAAKIGATAGALLNRFSAAKDLWHLREDALKGSDRLAKFLRGVLAQLK
jgi:adenosylhomocysteine nucleosidase